MSTRPQRIDVTIDRLVLRGFAPGDRGAIAAGLVAELQRLLGDQAGARLLGASRSLASLRAAPVSIASSAAPHGIGTDAARGFVRSIRS